MKLEVIAQNLKTFTTQSLAVSPGGYLVPTLSGSLLQVDRSGTITELCNFIKAGFGTPFGISHREGHTVVTTTSQSLEHHIVKLLPNGNPEKVVDLSQRCGDFGAPFAIAITPRSDYLVTLSPDTLESASDLLQISPTGTVKEITNLSYGIPFGLTIDQDSTIVANQFGQLLRLDAAGKISTIATLDREVHGSPFSVVAHQGRWWLTTNKGWIVAVSPKGAIEPVINVMAQKFGLPAGIAQDGDRLVLTTGEGYLLRLG